MILLNSKYSHNECSFQIMTINRILISLFQYKSINIDYNILFKDEEPMIRDAHAN